MKNKKMLTALIWTALTFCFTVLIKVVDVQTIGPNGSSVGFAAINGKVADWLGVRMVWYDFSKVLGILAILLAVFIAFMGGWQWIRERDLKKVNYRFFAAAGLYAATFILYVLFDKIAVNYRPILVNDVLAPSYPSTHTMLGLVLFGSAVPFIRACLPSGNAGKIITACCCGFGVLTVITRFLSGYHWLTDIVGGIFFAGMLLDWYRVALDFFRKKLGE